MRFTKSSIVPSEFEPLAWYDLGGNQLGDIPFNLGAATRDIDGGAGPVENFTDLGTCCICGTHFRYGEVWRHEPSDLRITVGHVCARRYGLMASDPEYDRLHAAHIKKIERRKERMRIAGEIKEFMRDRRELFGYLKADHYIVRDLRLKLKRWGSLTEKQIALAKKIATEQAERQAVEDAKTYVPVPESDKRLTVEGTVLGIKWVEGFGYNASDIPKMIVECDGEGGVFKLYGTMPDSISDEIMKHRDEGAAKCEGLRDIINRLHPRVRFTARLERSRDDDHFGFFKRPTKGEVLS